jgi:hypothetical protein
MPPDRVEVQSLRAQNEGKATHSKTSHQAQLCSRSGRQRVSRNGVVSLESEVSSELQDDVQRVNDAGNVAEDGEEDVDEEVSCKWRVSMDDT